MNARMHTTHDEQGAQGRLIDISIAIGTGLPVWPGDTPFTCGWTARREDGSSVNLASLHMSAHAGTHADAPLHVESAWEGSELLPPAAFVGDALVCVLPDALLGRGDALIDIPVLEHLLGDAVCTRLLMRTGCSVATGEFPEAWPTLTDPAAVWLLQRGVRLFGVDAPSVDARSSTALPIHHRLFAGGAFVLENLALGDVLPGRYELLAQPLLIRGVDAAPVRALLRAQV